MSNFMSGGNVSFNVTATTTFTMECSNAAGSSGPKSVTVNVAGTPPPAAVCGNGVVEGSDEVCDHGVQNGECPAFCSGTCKPNNCGPGGVLPTLSFTGGGTVKKGEAVTLTWTTTNATSCTRKTSTPPGSTELVWTGDMGGDSGSMGIVPGDGKTIGRWNYWLYCSNSFGSTPHDMFGLGYMVSVYVTDPPVINSFKAEPSTIDPGQSTVLKWSVSNATTCAVYKDASTSPVWSGDGVAVTEQTVSPATGSRYALLCYNASIDLSSGGRASAQKSVLVSVTGTPDPGSGGGGGTGGGGTGGGGTGGGGGGTGVGSITPCQNKDAKCLSPVDCKGDSTVVGACNNGIGVCCLAASGVPTPVLSVISVKNPLAFNTVEGLLNSILGFLQGAIAILSLIMIVIGALVYMTAAGDEKKVSTGKAIITAALVGLALAIAAPSFLKEIGTILDWGGVDGSAVTGAKTLAQIATSVLNFLLSVVGVIGIIMMVVGGLMYLTAAGDEDRIKTGKSITVYSIIGIAIALAALVLVTQIATLFQ